MIIPNKRWIVRNKSFMPWAFLQLHGYVGAKGWRALGKSTSQLEKIHTFCRKANHGTGIKAAFFPPCVGLTWKWKGVPEAGWICSHGRRLVDGAHLSQTAKHHNAQKGWWKNIVGGFSTFFESSLSAIGQGPLQQKTNGMIHHESLASPLWPTEKVTFNPQSSWN